MTELEDFSEASLNRLNGLFLSEKYPTHDHKYTTMVFTLLKKANSLFKTFTDVNQVQESENEIVKYFKQADPSNYSNVLGHLNDIIVGLVKKIKEVEHNVLLISTARTYAYNRLYEMFKNSKVYPTRKKYYKNATDELLKLIDKLFTLYNSEKEILYIENYIKESFTQVDPKNEDLLSNMLFDLSAFITSKLRPIASKEYRDIATEPTSFAMEVKQDKQSVEANKPYMQLRKGNKVLFKPIENIEYENLTSLYSKPIEKQIKIYTLEDFKKPEYIINHFPVKASIIN